MQIRYQLLASHRSITAGFALKAFIIDGYRAQKLHLILPEPLFQLPIMPILARKTTPIRQTDRQLPYAV